MLSLLIAFFYFQIIFIKALTPLSECTQGRITGYEGYQQGGACGFVPPKIYGAASNEKFYNKGQKCGVCYELVTPNSILYFLVDSYCPVKGNEAACNGDIYHFDLSKNAYDAVITENKLGKLNITFRMVACRHEGNIILKTKSDVGEYYYSFAVKNHLIGLKKVYYSFDNKTWIGLERELSHNHWSISSIKIQ